MSIRVISWNIYYGDIGKETPADRFNKIATIASANNVDVVLLQEHPGATSKFVGVNGLLIGAVVPVGYTYEVFPEMASNITHRVSASNRAYAILYKSTVTLGSTSYFQQAAFVDGPLKNYLRCPVKYAVTHGGTAYNC